MSATITAIADKDTGSVLGAVSEISAKEALKVDQVVAKTGFPLRLGVAVTLDVPIGELKTWAGAGGGLLTDPLTFVVKDGVPAPAALALGSITLKATEISVTFTTTTEPAVEVKAKAIVRNSTDGKVEVLPFAKFQPGVPIVVGATLRSGEDYDVLVMVEGYQAYFEEGVTVS
jgi:hypothetical protein